MESAANTLHVPVLVYITYPMTHDEQSSLISQLNEPNEEFLKPYPHLPKLLHQSPAQDLVGKTIEEILEIHRQWSRDQEIKWDQKKGESRSEWKSWPGSYMFVVAGDEASPTSRSRKVQVVHIPDGNGVKGTYQMVRASIRGAVGVINVAHADGWEWEGIDTELPDEEGEAADDNQAYQASAAAPRMTLPVKQRA